MTVIIVPVVFILVLSTNTSPVAGGVLPSVSSFEGASKKDPITEAIENGNGFQGDIILNPEQAAIIKNELKQNIVSNRSATTVNYHKWPKSGDTAVVPYMISNRFSYSERINIDRAISEFKSKTCIR